MRLASDALYAFAALWLLGATLALARWAQKPKGHGGARMPETYIWKEAWSYAAFAVFFAFVGLIVRMW